MPVRRQYFAFLVIIYVVISASLIVPQSTHAQTLRSLGALRQQAEIQQQWLQTSVERVLPQLIRRHCVQMWFVICREY